MFKHENQHTVTCLSIKYILNKNQLLLLEELYFPVRLYESNDVTEQRHSLSGDTITIKVELYLSV